MESTIKKKHLIRQGVFFLMVLLFLFFIVFSVLTKRQQQQLQTELTEVKSDYQQLIEQMEAEKDKKQQQTITDFPYVTMYPDLYVEPLQAEAVPEGEKRVYLSFDDGPSQYTPGILEVLKTEGVQATFFVVGPVTEERAAVMKRIVEEGHAIGIHTNTHNYPEIYASVENFLADFDAIFQSIYQATGVKPNIFRFPGGSINTHNKGIYQRLIAEMYRRGFTYYDWTVDSQDTGSNPTPEKMMNTIHYMMSWYQTPVVLMHDTKQWTLNALPSIISAYRDAGFVFDRLDHRDACYFSYSMEEKIGGS